jgi:acetolactate synthase regulatory subunit
MKYRVKHKDGEDIVEADYYTTQSLGIANVSIFVKNDRPVKHFLLTKSIERIEDEKEEIPL